MRSLLLILLCFSTITHAHVNKWFGKYHYEGSEEIVAGNVATMEIELKLTANNCQFDVTGFQVYEKYKCNTNEKNGVLYIYDLKSKKLLGKVTQKNKKYYIHSDEVLDPKDNIFFREE